MKLRAWALAALFGGTSPAAAVDIDYYRLHKSTEMMRVYVKGIAEGIFLSNVHNGYVGNKPIYCHPEGLAITLDQYVSILDAFLEKTGIPGSEPREMAVLSSLIRAFPCRKTP